LDVSLSCKTFSTLDRRLKIRTDVDAFRKGRILTGELLPTLFAEKVVPLFRRGDHDVAVFQAFKEVEVAVRNTANAKGAAYADSEVGTTLMRKAFHSDTGPLADKTLVPAEREAEMHLFAGAIGHAKNPTSHRDVAMTAPEAARLIVFASHLFEIVERRQRNFLRARVDFYQGIDFRWQGPVTTVDARRNNRRVVPSPRPASWRRAKQPLSGPETAGLVSPLPGSPPAVHASPGSVRPLRAAQGTAGKSATSSRAVDDSTTITANQNDNDRQYAPKVLLCRADRGERKWLSVLHRLHARGTGQFCLYEVGIAIAAVGIEVCNSSA
jgi:hypothetical protein